MKRYCFLIICFTAMLSVNVQAQEWISDMETAQKSALESHKTIILVFSGSDWCAPCMKLEKEIWNTSEFQEYAQEHYLMVRADFPKRKQNSLPPEQQEKNNALAEKYNTSGAFPLVVVLSEEGEVLGKTGYKGITVKEYIELLNQFIKPAP